MKSILVVAVTADGFIGIDPTEKATLWSTKADTRFFVSKTKEIGTVIMGRKTFETFGKPLADRRLIIMTSQPESVSVDGVETTSQEPAELLKRLEREGVSQVVVGGGSSIYRQFLAAGLADEIYLSVIPKVFGKGINLFDQVVDTDLQLLDMQKLDDENTVLLHYQVVKH